jgi:hypothetical protein
VRRRWRHPSVDGSYGMGRKGAQGYLLMAHIRLPSFSHCKHHHSTSNPQPTNSPCIPRNPSSTDSMSPTCLVPLDKTMSLVVSLACLLNRDLASRHSSSALTSTERLPSSYNMFAPNYNHDVCSLECIPGASCNCRYLASSEPIVPFLRSPDLCTMPPFCQVHFWPSFQIQLHPHTLSLIMRSSAMDLYLTITACRIFILLKRILPSSNTYSSLMLRDETLGCLAGVYPTARQIICGHNVLFNTNKHPCSTCCSSQPKL